MQEKFNPTEAIAKFKTRSKDLPLEIDERKITFELREPTMADMRAIRKRYVKFNASGMDINKSKLDELNYATVQTILYHNGEPAFSSIDEATQFLELAPVSIGNKIISECREICGDEDAEALIEELEKN